MIQAKHGLQLPAGSETTEMRATFSAISLLGTYLDRRLSSLSAHFFSLSPHRNCVQQLTELHAPHLTGGGMEYCLSGIWALRAFERLFCLSPTGV